MGKKPSKRCLNPECNRKFGDADDRKPGKAVKKVAGTSALCGPCYYAKYYKNNDVKKAWMKEYHKKRAKGTTAPRNLFKSYLEELNDRQVQQV